MLAHLVAWGPRTVASERRRPAPVLRIYTASWKLLRRLFVFAEACFVGFWLGVLRRETLHALDALYYDRSKMYHQEAFNRQGLFSWEQRMIDAYFRDASRVLVGGAGGGREMLALRRLGYEVEGFECNPRLAAFANALLRAEGARPNVHVVPRDAGYEGAAPYDGVVVGWSAYMLIQGRQRRVAFLQQLRAQMRERAPILLSFYARSGAERRFTVIAAIANTFRFLLRRDAVQVGDSLAPNFVHFCTRDEIARELREGGFTLAHYSTDEYGHAIGYAGASGEALA